MLYKTLSFLSIPLLLMACQNEEEQLKTAESVISEVKMKEYVKELAGDAYQGRKPFTPGETKTIEYLQSTFKSIGLEPANGDSYLQEVPLVKVIGEIEEPLSIVMPDGTMQMQYVEDFITFSRRLEDNIRLQASDMVFAGFGIVAPEYNWNDYKELDVKGKTVIVLVNDPGLDSGRRISSTGMP